MESDTEEESDHILFDAVNAECQSFEERVDSQSNHDHQTLAKLRSVHAMRGGFLMRDGNFLGAWVLLMHAVALFSILDLDHGVSDTRVPVSMFTIIMFMVVSDFVSVWADELLEGENQEITDVISWPTQE